MCVCVCVCVGNLRKKERKCSFLGYSDFIYILSSTDRLIRSIRTLQCGRTLEDGSKPIQLYARLSLRPLGQQADYVVYGNF